MEVLGVILARSGSVGLKNKHLLYLAGKPVICYTFNHAHASKLLTRVVVSTNSPEIQTLAQCIGIETIARPAALATNDASVQDVMLHAMQTVEARSPNFRADALVVLYGNVPIRGVGVIDCAIQKLIDTRCDSVRSFCPVGKWHPAWMAQLNGDQVLPLEGRAPARSSGSAGAEPSIGIHRRQDLAPLYLHDGAVVAVSRASMLRGQQNPSDPHAFFGVDRRAIRTEMGETVEIDHQRDLYWAEAVLRDQQQPSHELKVAV